MTLKHVLIFGFIFISSLNVEAFERYNAIKKYDNYFSKYSKRYFGPGFEWRYFKAQAVAESNLKPGAKSAAGAKGIMQILPSTFEEVKLKNLTIKGTYFQPRWNIAAGIYYDRTIWDIWKADRPFLDRIKFMFGSYNAGKGNVLRAQKIAKQKGMNPNIGLSIEKSLPQVTGSHSKETINYVKKIDKIREILR